MASQGRRWIASSDGSDGDRTHIGERAVRYSLLLLVVQPATIELDPLKEVLAVDAVPRPALVAVVGGAARVV